VRIAHVSDVYLPRLGGLELQVRDLAAAQSARGHEVHVLTTTAADPGRGRDESGDARSDAAGVLVRRLDSWPSRVVAPYHPLPTARLLAALRAGEYDVVHANASLVSPLAWTAARVAARAGIPTAVTVHSMWERSVPLVRGAGALLGAARWPVAWSAVSSAAAASVACALPAGTAVEVLPNGIEPAWWRCAPGAAAPGGGPLTVVSVMRMVDRKRPRELVRMVLRARELAGGVPLRLVLVGDGPLLPAVARDVRRAGAQELVELRGAQDRSEIRALHARAHLYVAPSRLESFGIAALEARSAGLPVLALRSGGVGDFVTDGVEGFLAADDEGLVRILAGLLARPEQLHRVAAHNREVAPSVSWTSVLAAADRLYALAAAIRPQAASPAPRSALGEAV
jgi:glycosyltransferase involved in cell wall biosynthesis